MLLASPRADKNGGERMLNALTSEFRTSHAGIQPVHAAYESSA
jgi:hypothetical protein